MTEPNDTTTLRLADPFIGLWQRYCDQKEVIADQAATIAALEAKLAAAEGDAGRFEWLIFHLPGRALRSIGVMWAERGDVREAIDAAMKEPS